MVENRRQRRGASRAVRSFANSSNDVVRDASRFVRALTEANAEILIGTSRVLRNLVVDVTDSIAGRTEEGDVDDDEENRGEESERRSGGESPRHRTLLDTGSARARDMSRSVSDALRESADVLSRSVDRFASVYDEEEERDERQEKHEGGVHARRTEAHDKKPGLEKTPEKKPL